MRFSTYQLKPKFQQLLHPILEHLKRSHITPNQVTALALGLSVLMGLLLIVAGDHLWVWGLLPLFLFVRMALNALDGMLAKSTGQVSAFGQLFNELADVISDVALYLPLAYVPFISAELVVIVVITAICSEFAGVCAVLIGVERRFDGPMAKSDRALAFGLVALLISVGLNSALWLNGLLAVIGLLSGYTLYNRVHHALRLSQS